MKTLHNIFHKDLFKTYFFILLTSVSGIVFNTLYPENKVENEFIKVLSTLSLIVGLVGPLVIFYLKKDFVHNIKFLINQHFSRLELIKFFFFSQTIRFVLLLFNYSVIHIVLYFLPKNLNKVKTTAVAVSSEFNTNFYLYSKYFIFVVMAYSFIYLFYFVSLFSANKAEIQRQIKARKLEKRSKKLFFIGWVSAFIVYRSLPEIEIPMALGGLLWSFALVYFAANVLNRTFRVFSEKKSYVYSFVVTFIACVPLYAIIYGMKLESHNPNLSYHERIDSAVYLGWMNSEFSKEDMTSFLLRVQESDYKSALELFKKKLDFNLLLQTASSPKRVHAFIDIFKDEKVNEVDVKVFVSQMSNLLKNEKIDFESAKKSEKLLCKYKMDPSYINNLINSRDSYQQYAAIVFAKKSFNKDQFAIYYKDALPLLNPIVVKSGISDRGIASQTKNPDSKNWWGARQNSRTRSDSASEL